MTNDQFSMTNFQSCGRHLCRGFLACSRSFDHWSYQSFLSYFSKTPLKATRKAQLTTQSPSPPPSPQISPRAPHAPPVHPQTRLPSPPPATPPPRCPLSV